MPLNLAAFATCANMSREAFYCIDNKLATYHELSTSLTLEDAVTLIEFHRVSEHNRQLIEGLKNEFSNGR